MAGWLGAFYVQGMDPKDSACMSPFNTIYSEQTPVMQFTGFHDIYGIPIYEGDILKLLFHPDERKELRNLNFSKDYILHTVVYLEDLGAYSFSTWLINNLLMKDLSGTSHVDFEVVGNIYQNPEMEKKVTA